jgi:hypothetical protein
VSRDLPGFNLRVIDGDDGPLLVIEGNDGDMLALVNGAALARVDVLARIRSGERFELGGVDVAPKPPDLDLERDAQQFCEDVGVERADFDEAGGFVMLNGDAYPIYVIADVAYALQQQRETWQRDRARASHARAAWERYDNWARDRSGLFRHGATPDDVAGDERNILVELDAKARLVDDLDGQLAEREDASQETIELAGTVSAKRRFLLGELAMVGLLDDSEYDRKLALLEQWKLHALADYLRAARAWKQYMCGPERAKFAPGIPVYPPTGGAALSIDWFRKPAKQLPPKVVVTPLEFAGYCEREAVDFFERNEGPGSGWWYSKSWAGVGNTFYYRFDDGIARCLYRVT